MPATSQGKTLVVCPQCGHQQSEPRSGISSNCRQCGHYLRVQELIHPVARPETRSPEQRHVACFDCGTGQSVPVTAKSAMCKRCSSYIDLQDYTISSAVSKNFRTKGRFLIDARGYLFNTTLVAREIVIKGMLIGTVNAEESLTIYGTAEIKGTFQATLLIVPEDNSFHWSKPLRVGGVDLRGELVGNIQASDTVTVRRGGRLFGDVEARHLVVEEGAIVVGRMRAAPPG